MTKNNIKIDEPIKKGPYIIKELMLMIFLRYLATGSFMKVSSELCSVTKSTAWKSIHLIIKSLIKQREIFIKFPDQNDLSKIEHAFRQKKGFPGVVGCVDGTHIPIEVPKSDITETFRNRKGYMSLNCQMICGPIGEIYDCITCWPGSTHDSRVWRESRIFERLGETISDRYHLLADSAYPISVNLLPPFKNPNEREHRRFNYLHSATRMAIEKAYGVIKRRFPLLKFGLRFRKVADSANCIVAAVILHNICLAHVDDIDERDADFVPNEDEIDEVNHRIVDNAGVAKRLRILNEIFG